jgi:hypothetical protein
MKSILFRLFLPFFMVISMTLFFSYISTSDEGGAVQMPTRNFSLDNAAYRAAALALLENLKTSRSALIDPNEWGPPLRLRGFRPEAIRSFNGLSFDDVLLPDSSLTNNEKLLIYGYAPKADPAVTMMPRLLAIQAYFQYAFAGRTTPDLLWSQNASTYTLEALRKEMALVVSPITGKLIELDHKEFSPGNAYVQVITPEEVKGLVDKAPSVDEWWNYSILSGGTNETPDSRITLTGKQVTGVKPGKLSGVHQPVVVYIRIYGEKGILIEGLF